MKNLEQLIQKHGAHGVAFEQFIYRMADYFSLQYAGGYWESKQVEDEEGFFLSLDDEIMYSIRNTQNSYSSGDIDSKTFSLAIFAFACNIAGNQAYNNGNTAFAEDLFDLFCFCKRNALAILDNDEKRHAQYYWFLD